MTSLVRSARQLCVVNADAFVARVLAASTSSAVGALVLDTEPAAPPVVASRGAAARACAEIHRAVSGAEGLLSTAGSRATRAGLCDREVWMHDGLQRREADDT